LPRTETPDDPIAAARIVAAAAMEHAADLDRDAAFPTADVAALAATGLLTAPVPRVAGGLGLGSEALGSPALLEVLRLLGSGNLSLGRLYEGHVNAWRLIASYASGPQLRTWAEAARAGDLFAVWNSQRGDGVRMTPVPGGFRLDGAKILASGTGHLTRPLITARQPDGTMRMVVVPLPEPQAGADPDQWRAVGMRASLSGGFDFTGIEVGDADLLGGPGDYERQPDFSAGAWRFAAVQLGGIEAIVDEVRAHLRRTERGGDPHQRARIAAMVTATITARLWLERAVNVVNEPDPDAALACVNLARLAVEEAGLQVMELAQRSVGLQAFLQSNPLERLCRDLATYLRQPNPDGARMAATAYVLGSDRPTGELWR
jgi:alkylation response protein AidB-like acyl-CoA dehydrogenase